MGRPGFENGCCWGTGFEESGNKGGEAEDEMGVNRDESHAAGRLNEETALKGANSNSEDGCEASASEKSARPDRERPSAGGGATWTSMAAVKASAEFS
jgi:hypothetical protein